MSEVTPSELVEEVTFTIEDAEVVPVPIDPTLSIEGEAADAKATGDAISGVFTGAKVNDKTFSSKQVTIYAGDIKMSDSAGAQTVSEAITAAGNRGADDIMYDAGNLVSVKDAIDSINEQIDTELSEAEIDDILDAVFGGDE